MFSFLCNVLQIINCPFVLFLMVIVFSVLRRFTVSDYPCNLQSFLSSLSSIICLSERYRINTFNPPYHMLSSSLCVDINTFNPPYHMLSSSIHRIICCHHQSAVSCCHHHPPYHMLSSSIRRIMLSSSIRRIICCHHQSAVSYVVIINPPYHMLSSSLCVDKSQIRAILYNG